MTNQVERGSYSIDEFCQRHGISRPTYFKWKREGTSPKETVLPGGGIIRIIAEDEVEWVRARQNPNEAEATLNRLKAEARKSSSKKAATAEGHPCNKKLKDPKRPKGRQRPTGGA